MKTLFLIPARAGSKGIVKKNIRIIGGKPLVIHSLDLAREFADDTDICISTDDEEVVDAAKIVGYSVPFLRPDYLANDSTSMRDVILHALDFYAEKKCIYDNVLLLQPTSPFRLPEHLILALELFDSTVDMVVSVMESKANPYFVLFEEDKEGFLKKSKSGNFISRQECPKVYQLNGAVYVINSKSIKEKSMAEFTKIRKIEMDQLHSVDLDTEIDWKLAVVLNEEYKLL